MTFRFFIPLAFTLAHLHAEASTPSPLANATPVAQVTGDLGTLHNHGTSQVELHLMLQAPKGIELSAFEFLLLEEHGHVPVVSPLPEPDKNGTIIFPVKVDWWTEEDKNKTYGEFRFGAFWLLVRSDDVNGFVVPLGEVLVRCFHATPLPTQLAARIALGGPNQPIHPDALTRAGDCRR